MVVVLVVEVVRTVVTLSVDGVTEVVFSSELEELRVGSLLDSVVSWRAASILRKAPGMS